MIFKRGGQSQTSYSEIKLASLEIRVSGVLVRDFIPVRVGSGANAVGYLYDRANPTGGPRGNGLYPNSGSGAFVIGPDVSAAFLLSSAPSLSPLSLEPSLESTADATESETQEEPQED